MNKTQKIIILFLLYIFLAPSHVFASVSTINFLDFNFFKETVQKHIINKNGLSEVTSANLDFTRANRKEIDIIKGEISSSVYNENNFLNSYTKLSTKFTNLSFDIYKESRFYLITNGILTPGLDSTLRRISVNQINQLYGLPSISVSIPFENSKYPLPQSSIAVAAPTVSLSTLAIATGFVVGASGGSGGGSGSGGGGGGSCADPCVTLTTNKTEIYDTDTSGWQVTATLSSSSSSNVTVSLDSSGSATQGSDFSGPTNIVIMAGQTLETIIFMPTADSTYEGTEVAKIDIASVTGGNEDGNQSVSINIKEYSLNLETSFTYQGDTLANNNAREASYVFLQSGDSSNPNSLTNMNIHKLWAYSDGTDFAKGKGTKVGVIDGSYETTHEMFSGKTITQHGSNNIVDATSFSHGTWVAAMAAGNGSVAPSVAAEADLHLATYTQYAHDSSYQFKFDSIKDIFNSMKTADAKVVNNSWGFRTNISGCNFCDYEVDEFQALMTSNPGKTKSQLAGYIWDNDKVTSNDFNIDDDGSATSGVSMDAAIAAMDSYMDTGVIVWANSNTSSNNDADMSSGLPVIFPELADAWINVVNVQITGNISSGTVARASGPCGQAAPFCVSADGYQVKNAGFVDAGGTSQYSTVSGTSMASPMISGAVAVMFQVFPNHTPAQIVDRILASANNTFFTHSAELTFDNGIKHGYNTEFGHGIPDFYAAMVPIVTNNHTRSSGMRTFVEGSLLGSPSGLLDTRLSLDRSFGNSILESLSDENIYFYDAMYGGFKYPFSNFIDTKEYKKNINEIIETQIQSLSTNISKESSYIASNSLVTLGEHGNTFSLSLNSKSGPVKNLDYYNDESSINYFAHESPFLNQDKGFGLTKNILLSNNHNLLFGYHDSSISIDPINNLNEKNLLDKKSFSFEFSGKNNLFNKYSLFFGTVVEDNSLLGSYGSGALNLNNNNPTSFFTGFGFEKNFPNDYSINYIGTIGETKSDHVSKSLITEYSNIGTFSLNASLKKKKLFYDNDEMNLTFNMPNQVYQGELIVKIPELASKAGIDGIIDYERERINLNQSEKQFSLDLSYKTAHSNKMFKLGGFFEFNSVNDDKSSLIYGLLKTSF